MELQKAADETDIMALCAPLVASFVFHSGGVLTTTLLAHRKLWPFVDAWLSRGNGHIINKRLVTVLDQKFWVLALRAALGRLQVEEILPAFFDDNEVKDILDIEPSSAELNCLGNLFLPSNARYDVYFFPH